MNTHGKTWKITTQTEIKLKYHVRKFGNMVGDWRSVALWR